MGYELLVIGQYGLLNTIYARRSPSHPPKARGTLRAFLSPPWEGVCQGDRS